LSKGSRPACARSSSTVSPAARSCQPEILGTGVEEVEPRKVGRPDRPGENGSEERPAELVGGKDIRTAVHDDGGRFGHRVQQPLYVQAHALRRRPVALAHCRRGSASEVVQVGAFGLVQVQRPGERVQDAVRDSGEVAAFETGVVLDADPASCATSPRRNPGTRRLP